MKNILVKRFKKVVGYILHYISKARVSFAPNLFLKAEQFWNEVGIEGMQKHPGYAEYSKILRSYIPDNARVLDVGCNKGFETKIISQNNQVVGIDAYKYFIMIAKSRGVDARVMDFHDMTFDAEFDCVYSNNSLEHAKYPDKMVQGVLRALKPGGTFVVGLPLDGNNLSVKDPAHFFRAVENDVVSLIEKCGFKVEYREVIDTKKRWGWENPSSMNTIFIGVARKPKHEPVLPGV